MEAIKSETSADVRLYPDPNAIQLKETLAEYYKTSADCVFVGNGSDEVLAFCFPAFLIQRIQCHSRKLPIASTLFMPISSEFRIKRFRWKRFFLQAWNFPDGMKGILLANPNAPTGIAIGLEAIEDLLQRLPDTLVIVDEAYVDFGAQSAISLVDRYDNLWSSIPFQSRSMAGLGWVCHREFFTDRRTEQGDELLQLLYAGQDCAKGSNRAIQDWSIPAGFVIRL